MGNCQAVDTATLVVQHPSGKIERHYWPISAREVMKSNPNHYVSLIIPLPAPSPSNKGILGPEKKSSIRYTRVKLLQPTDTLLLGRAYRLITSQEVTKVLRAKRSSKMKKSDPKEHTNSERRKSKEEEKTEPGTNSTGLRRPRSWRPSLQSISESSS